MGTLVELPVSEAKAGFSKLWIVAKVLQSAAKDNGNLNLSNSESSNEEDATTATYEYKDP